MEVSPVDARDAKEIERTINTFARGSNGGLIVLLSGSAVSNRKLIISIAARHHLPTVYSDRLFVVDGGLISYGPDIFDQYRKAAGYVDRILKGEKAADLPVQQATKYELVVNLKTAKTLGFAISAISTCPCRRGDRVSGGDVRFWPKADIPSCTAHVRFRG
jgi:putative ABC transport system substrate-binding protein